MPLNKETYNLLNKNKDFLLSIILRRIIFFDRNFFLNDATYNNILPNRIKFDINSI